MDRTSRQNSAVAHLYPAIQAFDRRMIPVGGGHVVYVEQSGNPNGVPVVVLHGGPGGGCSPMMRRFFDPDHYRIVLFDQRGCGKSTPHADVRHNTTWHLVRDIETIRQQLGISSWHVFGGSWGATLSLIYAQNHPDYVRSLILRGVFLMTQGELDWFYGGGVARFWPELWAQFAGMVPKEERSNLIAAYHRHLFSGNHEEEVRFARAWAVWENALATVDSTGMQGGQVPAQYARAFSRIENQYFINRGWLTPETDILNNMDSIAHIPGHIVQGRLDMICPPAAAYDVSKAWPRATLHMVAKAGHALSEPAITAALVRIMDELRE